MKVSSFLREHRALRWLVPAGVVLVIALIASDVFSAQASSDSLPKRTPAQLLAEVQSAHVPGFSGTIVAQASLGLPDLPALGGNGGATSITSLLSGSHTLRFWYGGADKQRVALLGSTSESDVFHNGRDVWQWNSNQHQATHTELPVEDAHQTPAGEASPQQLADRAIAAIVPSTEVTVADNRRVADRSAYDLVLTPRDRATRIGSVHIAVDGTTKIPLGLQVYARGSSTPAIDVSYSDVTFKKPSADNFVFTPPPGSTVHDATADGPKHGAGTSDGGSLDTVGSGWTTIAEYRLPANALATAQPGLLERLKAVHGAWGQGRLLESQLVSVLITDDGRVFAGAVDPSALYAAAANHK
jgi:outer membrane lipoprotein-sorting protein